MLKVVRTRLKPEGQEPHREAVASIRGCLFGLASAAIFWLVVAGVIVFLVRR